MSWIFGKPPQDLPDRPRPDDVQPSDDFLVLVDPDVDPRLVVYHDPHGFQAEQYRSFRTNLRAMNPKDESRTLLFTSANPEEGKTVTATNIALSLAERADLDVCLVDTDLRACRTHELLGCDREPGFTDILIGRLDPGDVIQATRLPNLSLISAGRQVDNPTEYISSKYLQDLIAWLKQRYHYVLFDSPPAGLFSDAMELSHVMDGVVLVVALGTTTRRDVDRVVHSMDAVGANVIGTFITGTDSGAAVRDMEERQYQY